MERPVKEKALTFLSAGFRLQGILHLPGEDHPPLIVGAHGLYSNGDSPKQIALAQSCARLGMAYFRFDHRGCHRSQGRFAEVTTLAGRRDDLVNAVAFLQTEFELGDRLGLFGSSFGGAACLAAAGRLHPHRMVTLAAPVDSRSILSAAEHQALPVEDVFLQEAFQFDLRQDLPKLEGVLVIHGGRDEVIAPRHAQVIHDGVGRPKDCLILTEGDHRLSRRDHQEAFLKAAVDWFKPLTAPVEVE